MTILENSSKSRETMDSSALSSNQKKIIRVSFVGGARKPLANADSLKRISTKLGIDDDESNLQQTVDEEQSFLENSMAAFSASGGSSQLLHARQEQYKDTYTIDEHGKKTNNSRSRINCSAVFMALVCIAIAITVGVVVSNKNNNKSGSSSGGDTTTTPALSPPHSDENPDHEEDFGIPVPPPPATTTTTSSTTTTGSSNSRPQVVASSETGAILQLGGTILTMTSAEQQDSTTTTSLSVALSGDGTRLVLIDGTSYMGHVWEWMDDGHDVVTDKDRWSWHLLGNAFQLPTSNAAIKDTNRQSQRASVAMAAHGNRIAMGGSQILVLDWNAESQKWSGVQLPGAGQVAMSSDGTRIVTIDSSSSSSNSDNTQVVQVTAYSLSHDRSEWAQIGKEIVLDAASRTKTNDPMVAMSSSGNRIVIAGTAFGIVTYDWDDSVADWFPVGSPLLQGTAIALSNNNDNQLVVGNPHDGTVVVNEWSTNNDNGNRHDNDWVQQGSILNSNNRNNNIQDAEDNDHYGYSVAGSNSRIVIGAVGYIQIWEWSDTQKDWEQVAKDITGEDHVHDDTGSTVAMAANGNRFAVSSRHHTTKVYAIIS